MNDYKHSARTARDPDTVVGVACAVSAVVFAVLLWAGVA
jgi:preprotein translocase subunit Sec61beta